MQAQDATRKRPIAIQFLKLLVYFFVIFLVALLTRKFFASFDPDSWAGFKKFTDLIHSTANVTAKRDDLIITGYSLFLTLLGVVPIGWVYTITKEEEGYDPSLVQTLIVLALTVCGVMLMLQDSLARAFGFLGVVGAVRYRNTLRDPKDAVFVFVALGIGMGAGLGVYHVAGALSLVLCLVFLAMWVLRVGQDNPLILPEKGGKGKDKDKKDKKPKEGKEVKKINELLSLLSAETRQDVEAELAAKRLRVTESGPLTKPEDKPTP